MVKHEVTSSDPAPKGAAEIPPTDPGKKPEPKAPERPEWLPEKFKTGEDMAKAYAELETKQSTEPKGDEPKGDEPKGEEKKDDVPIIEPKSEAEKNAFDKYSAEYAENGGKLSDETYAEIAEKHGLDRDMVDTYIYGQEARAKKSAGDILEAAGGEENWQAMVAWAADSLPKDQVDIINAGILKGGSDGVVAANALKSAFEAAGGVVDPTYITADGISTNDTDVFESAAQVRAAMSNPLYKTDEAYRQKVAAKLHRSTNIPV